MSDYSCYVLHTNRPDLTAKALYSIRDLGENVFVIDNSADDEEDAITRTVGVFKQPVPLTATQSINFAIVSGKRMGHKFILWMHNDAEAEPGVAYALVGMARSLTLEGRNWGVIFTNYDSFSAINLACAEEVGMWDTHFSAYFSDNDWYRRVRLAGWECINSDLPVKHLGSQTIKSDPEKLFLNSQTFPIYAQYYERKWGGPPQQEKFERPFGR